MRILVLAVAGWLCLDWGVKGGFSVSGSCRAAAVIPASVIPCILVISRTALIAALRPCAVAALGPVALVAASLGPVVVAVALLASLASLIASLAAVIVAVSLVASLAPGCIAAVLGSLLGSCMSTCLGCCRWLGCCGFL